MDLVTAYHSAIDGFGSATGISGQTAHLHAGLAIYLLTQLVLHKRRGSSLAILAVILAEAFHETMGRLFYGSWRWTYTSGDIVSTFVWPVLFMSVGRYRRWSMAHQQASQSAAEDGAALFRHMADVERDEIPWLLAPAVSSPRRASA